MTAPPPLPRLRVFLLTTFAITWGAWWLLVPLAQSGVLSFGQPLFMTLYMLGGFGPTIAAYVAVYTTRQHAPTREFHGRLFRWRVGPVWYLVAFGLPFAIAWGSVLVGNVLVPGSLERLALKPWSQLIPLFLTMIIGGGLEELGWRGVAQPELERRLSRAAAALVVGVVWALWHLPLFYLPGVGQYGTSFAIFALQVVGLAFILAWLYAATRSILFCVIFHAATNAALAMGITTPTGHSGPAVAGAVLKLILGVVLVFAIRQRSSNP